MCDNITKLILKYKKLNDRLSYWNKESREKNKDIYKEIIGDILDKLLQIKLQVKTEGEFIKNSFSNNDIFNKKQYFSIMEMSIFLILNKPDNENVSYDILDSEKTMMNKMIVLREKQRQMKIGEIWQMMIGNYDGFQNLKRGHISGLDVMSTERKIAIEIKNRTNTDNSSAKKTNFNKLAKFKRENPEFTCIYASINAETEKKTLEGLSRKISHNGYDIEYWVGVKFLKLIFQQDYEEVIRFVKYTVDRYSY